MTGLWLLLALTALVPGAAAEPDLADQLFAAAKQGDAAAVTALIDRGADPNAEFTGGGTALLYAAQRGHAEVVRVLLQRGASLAARDTLNQWTSLTVATFEGHCAVVKLLVEAGAELNEKDMMMGMTPVGMAAAKGLVPCLDSLLGSGRANRATLDGAFDLAQRTRRKDIAARLDLARQGLVEVARWPQFRGPGAAGVADGSNPPILWDGPEGKNLLWRTPIPGLGHSSPILWGDRLFVTTAVSQGASPEVLRDGSPTESLTDPAVHSFRLLAIDRADGKVLWEREAIVAKPSTGRHPKNTYASSTPATDGKYVVALFGSQGLYCYDFTGKLLWHKDLGTLDAGFFYDPDYQWGPASSPIVDDGRVYLQADGQKDSFVAAFDLADGTLLWRTARDEIPSWSTPAIFRGPTRTELITHACKATRAYDPATGKQLWELRTQNSMIAAATPISGLGLIFVGNGYRPLKPLYAIRPGASGDISLVEDATSNASVAWSRKSGGPYYTTPLLYGEHLYVASDTGFLTVYYALTGEQVYRARVGSGAHFSASPVAAEGRLYLTAEDGEVHVVKAGIEYDLLASNPVGEPCYATPALAEGTVYVRGRDHLFAFRQGASWSPPAEGTAPTGNEP